MARRSSAFGDLLRQYRVAAGLTQQALAERARVGRRSISDLERGLFHSPQRDTVARLAQALDLSARDRIGFAAAGLRRHGSPLSRAPRTSHPHNLPPQLTGLVGRERDVAVVAALLRRDDGRLLTLTGPPGVGKTRLSIAAAERLLDLFADGAFFVALAPVTDPDQVASVIAGTLGLREEGGRSVGESLRGRLRARHMLLVLDNFEHIAAAAVLVVDLLTACPRLTVLVTSRAPLHVRDEQTFAVSPLTLPDPTYPPPVDALTQYSAIELFLQRARACAPDFELTVANAPAVAAICRRLDGLPLAIELAASRIALLPPQALLARLERRLTLLIAGAHDLPQRQRTLRAAIAWSYDLLDADERALFARLGIFVGGCTFEAAEAVCGTAGDRQDTVLDGLASLMDKSLLRMEAAGHGEPRFGMLETIREYALERLAESGDEEESRRRHAGYYLTLAEAAEPELTGPVQGLWLERLEDEGNNLRAALRWTRESGEIETGLRLAGALWRFWYTRGYQREGRGWLEGLLALAAQGPGGPSRAARAKAFNAAGVLAYYQGDCMRAIALHEESLALRRELADKQAIASSLHNLASNVALCGDHERAVELYEESLALSRELGAKLAIAATLSNLGDIAREQGAYGRANALSEESLALMRELGDTWGIALLLTNLGRLAREQRDYGRAAGLYAESLALYQRLGDKSEVIACLQDVADLVYRQGQAEQAARLYGAVAAARDANGHALSPVDQARFERETDALRATLGADSFTGAWMEGRALPLERIVEQARAVVEEASREAPKDAV